MLPNIGTVEMMVIGIIAILLFGKDLPSVGRSLGRSFMEFKKGLTGIQDQFNSAMQETPGTTGRSSGYRSTDDYEEPTAPRFEPPASAVSDSTSAITDSASEANDSSTVASDFSAPTGESRNAEELTSKMS